MDVDCCEGGRGESGSGEEKNDDMAECGEGGDGECVLGRGDGEWGCEDGARGEDDPDRKKRGGCHWRSCGKKALRVESIENDKKNYSLESNLLSF